MDSPGDTPSDTVTDTRRALHAVGELVLAGPQFREHGTIRLTVTPDGFGQVAGPLRVQGPDLVTAAGRVPLVGTVAEVAAIAGVAAGAPEGLYDDHAELGAGDELLLDPDAARLLAVWFALGDAGLRSFAPGSEPVLWPEHFDVAISLDEVNYGISAGDAGHPAPYAYVGPWEVRDNAFWNVSFGAVRAAAELPTVAAVAGFFAEGRAAAAG